LKLGDERGQRVADRPRSGYPLTSAADY
jgi:hypothetical protein